MSAVIDFNLWSHTPLSQVVCLNRLCTYIFHTSGGILKKICFFGFPDKAFPCKCRNSCIAALDANCFHAEWLWLILRVFRSQIESIYPRLKEDYAFDCATPRRCGNHPATSKNLDANHLNHKAKDSYFSVAWSVAFDSSSVSRLVQVTACTSSVHQNTFRKAAVAFF